MNVRPSSTVPAYEPPQIEERTSFEGQLVILSSNNPV